MNIRPTDSPALAAATDLFAVVAPVRDDWARGDSSTDFNSALRCGTTAPAAQSESPPERTSNRDDKPSQPNGTPASQAQSPGNDAHDEPVAVDETDDADPQSAEPAAEATTTQPVAAEDEELTDEERAARDLAAESLIAVSSLHSTKQLAEAVQTTGEELVAPVEAIDEDATAEAALAGAETLGDKLPAKAKVVESPSEVSPAAEPILTAEAEATTPVVEPVSAEAEVKTEAHGIGVLPSALVSQAQATANVKEVAPSADKAKAGNEKKTSNVAAKSDPTAQEPTNEPAEGAIERKVARDEEVGEKADNKLLEVAAAHPSADTPLPHEATKVDASIAEVADSTIAPAISTGPETSASTAEKSNTSTVPPNSLAATNAAIQRLPAHALVRGVAAGNTEPAPLQVDAARFLQRVAKAFESAKERGGEIRLRLSPPELGALRVEVIMHNDGLIARVEAETPDARAVLIENLPALRERLAEQGLRLERFDVDLQQRQPGEQQSDGMPDRSNHRQPGSSPAAPRGGTAARTAAADVSPAPSATNWTDRQLNVIV